MGIYVEYDETPLSNFHDVKELEDFEAPDVNTIWDFSNIKSDAEKYKDYAVVYDGAVLFQFCQALRGFQQLMMDMQENPEIAQTILSKVVDYWIKFGRSLLEAAQGGVDIFVINDDYGSQQNPIFNPKIWREFIKPLVWKAIRAYKEYDVKIMFHSCGSIRPFLPDLIEMGVDVIDPVQVSAKGMIPIELKQEFGQALSFRGAVDTQKVLPYGTPDDVRQEVRTRIQELASHGGYICCAVHNLQPDVPPDNIVAMYEAAMVYGQYPLQ